MNQGLCDICGNIGRLHSCVLCGKRVCPKCYIPEKGVCIACSRGMQFESERRE
ncbi:MAG: orotate phosphoribosyltransferase [Candidatus Altiarchaeota archaeon]|nr:orotate phosphoribosyltransferase [Candidatus Altiarchaeota archaeon]